MNLEVFIPALDSPRTPPPPAPDPAPVLAHSSSLTSFSESCGLSKSFIICNFISCILDHDSSTAQSSHLLSAIFQALPFLHLLSVPKDYRGWELLRALLHVLGGDVGGASLRHKAENSPEIKAVHRAKSSVRWLGLKSREWGTTWSFPAVAYLYEKVDTFLKIQLQCFICLPRGPFCLSIWGFFSLLCAAIEHCLVHNTRLYIIYYSSLYKRLSTSLE